MVTAKKTNFSTILSAGLALAAFSVWSLGEYVNENLALLSVKALPTAPGAKEDAKPFDVKTLFPVWVASASKAHHSDDSGSVNDLFKDQPPPSAAPAAPVEPNYAALLGSKMRLDGIGEGGAFINGKFYHVGEGITDFEYPEKARQVVPRLAEVRAKSVVVIHGKNKTEIKI